MANRMDLNGWYKLRWQILERDKYTCQYCGQYAPNIRLEVDHKLALADGGTNEISNLITSCWACNMGKSGLRQSIVLKRQRKNVKIKDLPDRQSIVLSLMKQFPGLTTNELSDKLNITMNNARLTLCRLKKKSKIFKDGKKWFIISSPLH
jgi:hypothetical protein